MTAQPERVPPAEVRIGDADRENIAKLLHDAAAQGRLDLNELDERLAGVYAARTYGDLTPLTRDLPDPYVPVSAPAPARSSAPSPGLPASTGAVAVMGGFERTGRWSIARLFTCVAFFGGGKLDLREAVFVDGGTNIRVWAVMGGVDVVVPDDADVQVTGIGVMGGFDHGASGSGRPGGPTIVISGLAFMGGVSVRRRSAVEG